MKLKLLIPVRTRESGEEEYHECVEQAFDVLVEDEEILSPGIISGRGVGYLLGQVEQLGLSEIDLAGEMGATYFLAEDLEGGLPSVYDASFVVPEDEANREDIYRFNLELIEELAEDELQLMYGDFTSNVIGSVCVEAYGVNLEEDRFSVEDTVYGDIYNDVNAQSVQRDITSYQNGEYADLFDLNTDKISFEKSIDAVGVLTDVMGVNPFIPWSFRDKGDRIVMFPEYRVDPDFDFQDFETFVDQVNQIANKETGEEFWTSTYNDFSFDFGKKGYEDMKTRAAETILNDYNFSKPVVPTNTGDKPTDVLNIDKSLFFAQSNTDAERYCQKNNIPYVEVENTVESFLIQAELA